MREFTALCLMWLKGYYCKRQRYILLTVLLTAFICGYTGSSEYNHALTGKKDFQSTESSIAANMLNYTEVSKYGISVRSIPSSNSVFFANPSVTSELHGRTNTVAVLDTQNGTGEFNVGGDSIVRLSFSRLVFILLTLWAMYMPFAPLRHKEFLKFLAAPCSLRKTHMSILTAAFVSITANFAAAFAASTAGVLAGGVSLEQLDFARLLPYLAVCLLLLMFFVVLGFIAGTHSSPDRAYKVLFIIWFALIFVVPPIIDTITDNAAGAVPSANSIYDDKQKVINDFEKNVKKNEGKFEENKRAKFGELAEIYRKEHFPKVEALDKGRGDKMAKKITLYDILSGLSITSFYKRVEAEAGSRGYLDYIRFYNYLLKLRRDFLDFWIFRVYHNDPNEIVPFVKADENLYFARGGLPSYFVWVFLFNFSILVFILLPVSFRRFRTYLYTPEIRTPAKEDNPHIPLHHGVIRVLRIFRPRGESEKFYNLFAGEAGFNEDTGRFRISLDAEELEQNDKKIDFVYVCHPGQLPGHMSIKNFIAFAGRLKKWSAEQIKTVYDDLGPDFNHKRTFGELDNAGKGTILLAVLRYFKPGVFLVDNMDVNSGMPPRFVFKLRTVFIEWKAAGSAVLYFTLDSEIKIERSHHRRDRDYLESELWCEQVKAVEDVDDLL